MSEILNAISVDNLFSNGKDLLGLEIVAGSKGLDKKIIEATINRPGLGLTGFYTDFAPKRVQLIGLAEYSYLGSLTDSGRLDSLRELFSQHIPCLVFCRGHKVYPEVISLAEEFETPVFVADMETKLFINKATIILENLMAPHKKVHGTMVEIHGIGVLIEGIPGVGKSEAALGLIKKGHALVSDDTTQLRRDSSGKIIAAPVNVTRYHMEIRGLGIIHVPSVFGVSSIRGEKKLDFVATLRPQGEDDEHNRCGTMQFTKTLLGVDVKRVYIPVAPGRDVVNILETAALDFKLKTLGHDAVKELDERVIKLMSGGSLDGND